MPCCWTRWIRAGSGRARGLAHNSRAYKSYLANCDLPRRNDLNGGGSLRKKPWRPSRVFSGDLPRPGDVHGRADGAEAPADPHFSFGRRKRPGQIRSKAGQVLEAVLYRGELPRGDVASLLGSGGRHARRIMAELSKVGVLTSDTSKAPPAAGFPGDPGVPLDAGPLPRANALTPKGNAVQRRPAPRQRRYRSRRRHPG
jgi:hypothetical protein